MVDESKVKFWNEANTALNGAGLATYDSSIFTRTDLQYTHLIGNEDFQRAARHVYDLKNGHNAWRKYAAENSKNSDESKNWLDKNGELTALGRQKLGEEGIDQIRWFNNNFVSTGVTAAEIFSKANADQKLGFLYMMQAYEETHMSRSGAWAFAKQGILYDPTTWASGIASVFSLGTAGVAVQGAKEGAKFTLIKGLQAAVTELSKDAVKESAKKLALGSVKASLTDAFQVAAGGTFKQALAHEIAQKSVTGAFIRGAAPGMFFGAITNAAEQTIKTREINFGAQQRQDKDGRYLSGYTTPVTIKAYQDGYSLSQFGMQTAIGGVFGGSIGGGTHLLGAGWTKLKGSSLFTKAADTPVGQAIGNASDSAGKWIKDNTPPPNQLNAVITPITGGGGGRSRFTPSAGGGGGGPPIPRPRGPSSPFMEKLDFSDVKRKFTYQKIYDGVNGIFYRAPKDVGSSSGIVLPEFNTTTDWNKWFMRRKWDSLFLTHFKNVENMRWNSVPLTRPVIAAADNFMLQNGVIDSVRNLQNHFLDRVKAGGTGDDVINAFLGDTAVMNRLKNFRRGVKELRDHVDATYNTIDGSYRLGSLGDFGAATHVIPGLTGEFGKTGLTKEHKAALVKYLDDMVTLADDLQSPTGKAFQEMRDGITNKTHLNADFVNSPTGLSKAYEATYGAYVRATGRAYTGENVAIEWRDSLVRSLQEGFYTSNQANYVVPYRYMRGSQNLEAIWQNDLMAYVEKTLATMDDKGNPTAVRWGTQPDIDNFFNYGIGLYKAGFGHEVLYALGELTRRRQRQGGVDLMIIPTAEAFNNFFTKHAEYGKSGRFKDFADAAIEIARKNEAERSGAKQDLLAGLRENRPDKHFYETQSYKYRFAQRWAGNRESVTRFGLAAPGYNYLTAEVLGLPKRHLAYLAGARESKIIRDYANVEGTHKLQIEWWDKEAKEGFGSLLRRSALRIGTGGIVNDVRKEIIPIKFSSTALKTYLPLAGAGLVWDTLAGNEFDPEEYSAYQMWQLKTMLPKMTVGAFTGFAVDGFHGWNEARKKNKTPVNLSGITSGIGGFISGGTAGAVGGFGDFYNSTLADVRPLLGYGPMMPRIQKTLSPQPYRWVNEGVHYLTSPEGKAGRMLKDSEDFATGITNADQKKAAEELHERIKEAIDDPTGIKSETIQKLTKAKDDLARAIRGAKVAASGAAAGTGAAAGSSSAAATDDTTKQEKLLKLLRQNKQTPFANGSSELETLNDLWGEYYQKLLDMDTSNMNDDQKAIRVFIDNARARAKAEAEKNASAQPKQEPPKQEPVQKQETTKPEFNQGAGAAAGAKPKPTTKTTQEEFKQSADPFQEEAGQGQSTRKPKGQNDDGAESDPFLEESKLIAKKLTEFRGNLSENELIAINTAISGGNGNNIKIKIV